MKSRVWKGELDIWFQRSLVIAMTHGLITKGGVTQYTEDWGCVQRHTLHLDLGCTPCFRSGEEGVQRI